jgi:putative endonuclease
MYYVYILQSERDKELYIGRTSDLRRRYAEHTAGRVDSTKHRLPLKLLCYEAYNTKEEAARREEYLKSSDGKKDIRKRIIESILK